MNNKAVLRVDSLGKCFKIYSNSWHRALEWINFGKRTHHKPFWALQDISFEVKRGEFLGIIGQNGAGKSTLLKILSGVLEPTSGTYQVNGKILSMLELGMDFNPYLSGRQNVIRSAELWGFPDGYVQERMEQIIEFSELGQFFDRPVGLYSTGMTARLAFSLFAFLECDILILDEVLAVGDLFFRQKCYARLEELIANNTTILFVTHEMEAVQHYCDHVILLDKGRIAYQGEAKEAIFKFYHIKSGWDAYRSSQASPQHEPQPDDSFENEEMFWPAADLFTPGPDTDNGQAARLVRFAVCDAQGKACLHFPQGKQITFYCEFYLAERIGIPITGVYITNKFNVVIHGKNTLQCNVRLPYGIAQGRYLRFCQHITLNVAPGEYVFNISFSTIPSDDYKRFKELTAEKLEQRRKRLCILQQAGYFIVTPLHGEGLKGPHVGLCDLPGSCSFQVISNNNITHESVHNDEHYG